MKFFKKLNRMLGKANLKDPAEKYIHSLRNIQIYTQQILNGDNEFSYFEEKLRKQFKIVLETTQSAKVSLPPQDIQSILLNTITISQEYIAKKMTQRTIDAIKEIRRIVD